MKARQTALERFRCEAMRACRAHHENAVQAMEFGLATDQRPVLVMELPRGP